MISNQMYPTMMPPERDRAYVDQTKITDYLLSRSHPDGRTKAEFFMRFGFAIEKWQELAEALRAAGASNPVESPHGCATLWTVRCRPGWACAESAHGLDGRAGKPRPATDHRVPDT